MASRVVTLAAEFGWPEDFILLWLPVARGEQYYHALLRRIGWRTYLPAPPVAEQLAELDAAAAGIAGFDVDPEMEAAWARFAAQK